MKEFASETGTRMNRRKVLQTGAAAFTATAIGSSAVGLAQGRTQDTYLIRDGTVDETEVVVIDSEVSGPTAVVVGGMHGNEAAGYRAAQEMREWSIDAGKLVLIPESNSTAIEANTLSNDNGNLNRKFLPGETPTTTLARAIWNEITSHDADVVFNLHSSKGIYQEDVGPSGVGQAIYPTTANGAQQNASRTVEYMNENHLDDSHPDYLRFKRGNLITGERPLLIHKVDHDLQQPGFIVEVTRYETSLDTRIDWTLQIVEHLLSQYSINRMSADSSDEAPDEPSTDTSDNSADNNSTDPANNTSNESSTESSDDGADEQSSNEDSSVPESDGWSQFEQLHDECKDTTWTRLIRGFF